MTTFRSHFVKHLDPREILSYAAEDASGDRRIETNTPVGERGAVNWGVLVKGNTPCGDELNPESDSMVIEVPVFHEIAVASGDRCAVAAVDMRSCTGARWL